MCFCLLVCTQIFDCFFGCFSASKGNSSLIRKSGWTTLRVGKKRRLAARVGKNEVYEKGEKTDKKK